VTDLLRDRREPRGRETRERKPVRHRRQRGIGFRNTVPGRCELFFKFGLCSELTAEVFFLGFLLSKISRIQKAVLLAFKPF
jgi:hypothetical protein